MNKQYRICLSSPPDREKLVAEIFFRDVQWVEINQEHGALEVEFYPRPDGEPWRIECETVFTALKEAKEKLIGE